jgi:hypothetical protein
MNANEFLRNCEAHSVEELTPYEGKYVAWSMDGKQILAAACELSELLKDIDRRGITEFVQSYIPRSDDAFLGSADLA